MCCREKERSGLKCGGGESVWKRKSGRVTGVEVENGAKCLWRRWKGENRMEMKGEVSCEVGERRRGGMEYT